MTDWDRPRPFFIIALVFGVFLIFVSWRLPSDNGAWQFMKFFVGICGAGFLLWGAFGFIEYMTWLWSEINQARYSIILADHISHMNPTVAEIWKNHTDIEVIGMIGPDITPRFAIQGVNGERIPWEFAQSFIEASRAYYPNTAPIGQAYDLTDNHVNAERLASSLIGALAVPGYVVPGVGNKTGVFKVTWEQLARGFNLE